MSALGSSNRRALGMNPKVGILLKVSCVSRHWVFKTSTLFLRTSEIELKMIVNARAQLTFQMLTLYRNIRIFITLRCMISIVIFLFKKTCDEMYLCMCVRACVEFVNYNMLRQPCHISKPMHDDDNCRSVKQTRQIGEKAATGILILLKLDSNRRFFCQCDLDIWRLTSKHNSAPLLYYVNPTPGS